jgi:hypothetical protein
MSLKQLPKTILAKIASLTGNVEQFIKAIHVYNQLGIDTNNTNYFKISYIKSFTQIVLTEETFALVLSFNVWNLHKIAKYQVKKRNYPIVRLIRKALPNLPIYDNDICRNCKKYEKIFPPHKTTSPPQLLPIEQLIETDLGDPLNIFLIISVWIAHDYVPNVHLITEPMYFKFFICWASEYHKMKGHRLEVKTLKYNQQSDDFVEKFCYLISNIFIFINNKIDNLNHIHTLSLINKDLPEIFDLLKLGTMEVKSMYDMDFDTKKYIKLNRMAGLSNQQIFDHLAIYGPYKFMILYK